jgi:hypothetical protein
VNCHTLIHAFDLQGCGARQFKTTASPHASSRATYLRGGTRLLICSMWQSSIRRLSRACALRMRWQFTDLPASSGRHWSTFAISYKYVLCSLSCTFILIDLGLQGCDNLFLPFVGNRCHSNTGYGQTGCSLGNGCDVQAYR